MKTQTNKILPYVGLLSVNFTIILIIVFLQLFFYGTTPAIDSDRSFNDKFEKKEASVDSTKAINKVLIIEMLIGGLVLTGLNLLLLKKSKTNKVFLITIALLVIYLLSTGLCLTYFTLDYINKNVAI